MTELLRIEWKGRIGYGDIISPICYAHVMAQKNHCDVELLFHWSEKKGQKYKPEDAESLDYRAEYLASEGNDEVNLFPHLDGETLAIRSD